MAQIYKNQLMKIMPTHFPYIERDESWMYFNRRLLFEAERNDIPLLERLNYLGIYSSNLDEFFRVRIASLRKLSEVNSLATDEQRLRAKQTLIKVARLYKEYSVQYEKTLEHLTAELAKEKIYIINELELNSKQEEEVRRFYMEHVSSTVNPIFICSTSFVPERHLRESLYLVVSLRPNLVLKEDGSPDLAILEIPTSVCGRFIRLSDGENGESYIIMLDDVLRFCLPYIFAGMPYTEYEAYTFKLTKDSEIEIETDLRRSVIDQVSRGLKQRKNAEPIRVVYDIAMPEHILERLCQLPDLCKTDTLLGGGRYHNIKDMMKFPDCGRKHLRFPEWKQCLNDERDYADSILERIRAKDLGIHFPYQSFDMFLRVLREAAISPQVSEIRITLYRVAQHSKVIGALLAAAQNGKRVTAVVELLARFDEESNINWSKKLQEAGVHVIFGHEKFKIHSKLVHITTTQGGIVCIGTGNLHEGNARLYTDYMLMTAEPSIAKDVYRVFDFIETPYLRTEFKHLLVSPNDMRHRLVALIDREIEHARRGRYAAFKIKINHIVDEDMVVKLYEASQAGVQIDLCVRGNCSVVPGLIGVSENIRINAIIDRYLEHPRIYIFENNGQPEYYLGSTDWMTRNLDRRIEVMAPVLDLDIQRELRMIVEYSLRDTAQGYQVNQGDRLPLRLLLEPGAPLFRSQEALYNYYQYRNTTK